MNNLSLYVRFDENGEVITIIWQPEEEIVPQEADTIAEDLYILFRDNQYWKIKKDPDGKIRLKTESELALYQPAYGFPIH